MLDVVTRPNELARTSFASEVRTLYYVSCMTLALVSLNFNISQ